MRRFLISSLTVLLFIAGGLVGFIVKTTSSASASKATHKAALSPQIQHSPAYRTYEAEVSAWEKDKQRKAHPIVHIPVVNAFTTDAVALAGGQDKALNGSRAAVKSLNEALDNSGVPYIHFDLKGTIFLSTSTGSKNADQVQTWEDNLADSHYQGMKDLAVRTHSVFYALFTTGLNEGGQASAVNSDWAHPGRAVIIDTETFASGALIYAHEVGHLLGLNHDKFIVHNLAQGNTGYGYVNLKSHLRDIMSYDDACEKKGFTCAELPYFSNPHLPFLQPGSLGNKTADAVGFMNAHLADYEDMPAL